MVGKPNAFEASIEAKGEVLHRDKQVARSLAVVMAVSTVFFLAASIAYAMGWGADVNPIAKILTYLITPLFPYVLLTGTVMRTVVTTEEVRLQWGLRGKSIPLESITKCEIVDKEESRVRTKTQRTHLMAPGKFEEAVWLEWTDGDATQYALVGSDHPGSLHLAIEQARGSKSPAVRIAAEPPSADVDAEAEAEAAAEEEAQTSAEA